MIRHFCMLPTVSFRSCSIELLYRPLSIFRRSRTAYVGQFVLNSLFSDTDVDSKFFSPVEGSMVQLHTTGDDGTLTRVPPEKKLDNGLEQLTRSKRGFVVAVARNILEKKLWL